MILLRKHLQCLLPTEIENPIGARQKVHTGAHNLCCGGGGTHSIFLLFHWGIRFILVFPSGKSQKRLWQVWEGWVRPGHSGRQQVFSSLHTPLTSSGQHLPSLPTSQRITRSLEPGELQHTLSSSGVLCSSTPTLPEGKQATPQMQESVTLKILKTNVSLCCLSSLYDHCLRIKDSRQDVDNN